MPNEPANKGATPAEQFAKDAGAGQAAAQAVPLQSQPAEPARPDADAVRDKPVPAPPLPSAPAPAAAVAHPDTKHRAPNEVTTKSATNAPAPHPRPDLHGERIVRNVAATATLKADAQASDILARAKYAQLGDRVEIDGDMVPVLDRQDHHQYIYDHGLQAAQGRVIGAKVSGNIYYLQVETPTNAAWIPAECVRAIPDMEMQPATPRSKAPERQKKHHAPAKQS
jgi:hypothetical protein